MKSTTVTTTTEPTVTGILARFLWRAEEDGNDYLIGILETEAAGEVTIKGRIPDAQLGVSYRLSGRWDEDRFGRSLRFSSAARVQPTTLRAIEAYLMTLPGIGNVTARQIVGAWGIDSIDALKNKTAREISAVAKRLNAVIVEEIRERIRVEETDLRVKLEIRSFLGAHGTDRLVTKILDAWGPEALATLQAEPWRMADEIRGIGFLTADEIAIGAGCDLSSPARIRAAVLFEFNEQRSGGGHTVHDQREIRDRVVERLRFSGPSQLVADQIDGLLVAGRLCRGGAPESVCLATDDRAERAIAESLGRRLAIATREGPFREPPAGFGLAPDQQGAFLTLQKSTTVTLTGAPGTGKTHCVRALLEGLYHGKRVALCAPTGKAARRLSQLTGQPAQTIHRLLEPMPREVRGKTVFGFARGADYPIEADLVVVDEASMVDVRLMADLLAAIPPSADLLIVGDHHQLASVGPGAVLRDLLECGRIPAVELTTIKRQDPGRIVTGCHAVKDGRAPAPSNAPGSDLNVVRAGTDAEVLEAIVDLALTRLRTLPEAGTTVFDQVRNIQVLMPFRAKRVLSAETVNAEIAKRRRIRGEVQDLPGARFGIGDRVIQTRNDYALGIVNGDLGIVHGEVNQAPSGGGSRKVRCYVIGFEGYDQTVTVSVGENSLEFSYAMTIHKSQGSEWPIVVIPVHESLGKFFDRTLLYTAMSRASKRCALVGTMEALPNVVRRVPSAKRRTRLGELLKGVTTALRQLRRDVQERRRPWTRQGLSGMEGNHPSS